MCAIASVHASTHATSLMRVKNSMCHLGLWHLLSETMEQKIEGIKTSNLIVVHFSLTFVTLSLA